MPAMALLRRPDDHRRELRARWPNSRSAVASGRGQDRNAMTSVTASPRPRLPRSLAFGVTLLSPRCLPKHLLHRRSGQNRPTDHGGSDKLATAIVAPAHSARQRISNPSRRPVKSPSPATVHPAARGFLPGRLSDAGPRSARELSRRTGIRNPSPTRSLVCAASKVGCGA